MFAHKVRRGLASAEGVDAMPDLEAHPGQKLPFLSSINNLNLNLAWFRPLISGALLPAFASIDNRFID